MSLSQNKDPHQTYNSGDLWGGEWHWRGARPCVVLDCFNIFVMCIYCIVCVKQKNDNKFFQRILGLHGTMCMRSWLWQRTSKCSHTVVFPLELPKDQENKILAQHFPNDIFFSKNLVK